MAVTHPEATRNGIADFVVDQLNSGTLEIQTSGDVEVATCGFAATAFGAAAAGVATAGAITADADATGGTAAKAQLKNSGGTAIVNCSVGTSGEDINLSSVTIGAGDTVEITSLTYTAPL
jgi:acyl-coenzyme A thioesterase PaaI-like protein